MEVIIEKAINEINKEVEREKKKIALFLQREAIRNAPKSPTKAQLQSVLKKMQKAGKAKKMKVLPFRNMPGGLERSIEQETRDGDIIIFVASNSEAGSYAKRIHDGKGRDWHKRGIGTVLKGSRADDKFIRRAIAENERTIRTRLQQAIEKGISNV